VKVKVLSIYDEPYKGSYRVPPAEQVESTLREWLKDNPNAKIEHVAQTPLADLDGRTYSLLVTIFYRDWTTYATTPRGIGGTSIASTAARMSVP
jgi:hypothetical protein